jgi:hypothetical protein
MTAVIAFLMSLLNAVAAVPALAKYADEFAAGVFLWYVKRQNKESSIKIADAAAFAARSETQEDRLKASAMWETAIKRPRYEV